MDLIEKALEFETRKKRGLTTSDRVKLSREAKALILGLNEIYKEKKDAKIMDSHCISMDKDNVQVSKDFTQSIDFPVFIPWLFKIFLPDGATAGPEMGGAICYIDSEIIN